MSSKSHSKNLSYIKKKSFFNTENLVKDSVNEESEFSDSNEEVAMSKIKNKKSSKNLILKENKLIKNNIKTNLYSKQLKISNSVEKEKESSIIESMENNMRMEFVKLNIRQFIDKEFTYEKRKFLTIIISFMSFASFLIYLLFTYYTDLLYILDYFDYAFCSVYLLEFILYLLLAQHKIQYILTTKSLIDLIIISPIFFLTFQEKYVNSLSSSNLTCYINITRILRVTRIFQVFYIIRSEGSDISKQIFMIISTILMILLIFSGVLQVVENDSVNLQLKMNYDIFIYDSYQMRKNFHHYIYFSIITISTVGYGDIVPLTLLGKLLVVLLVLIIIALIPKQTNELIQLISAQSEYARSRYKSSTDIKHIILTGDITHDSLKSFCLELFHSDHGTQYKHAIIISPKIPSQEMESLINSKQYENFIRWLEGDPMNDKDLLRCDINKAKGCVIFNNKNSVDPFSSDHRNILLAVYIKKFVYNNSEALNINGYCNFRLFIQLIKPENKYHYYNSLQKKYKEKMPLDNLILIEEIKLNLLAKSCLTPGIMAMISNLVMSTSNIPNHNLEWLKEYSDGRGHEIYRILLSENYKYLSFLDIAKEVYSKERAIAFALEIEINKISIIKLNPGNITIDTVINNTNLSNENKKNIKYNISQIKLYLYVICSDKQIADTICGNNLFKSSLGGFHMNGSILPAHAMTTNYDKIKNKTYSTADNKKGSGSIVQTINKNKFSQGNNFNDSFSEGSDNSEYYMKNEYDKKDKNYFEDYEIDLNNYYTMKNFDVINFHPNVDIMQHTIKDSKEILDHILVCGTHPNLFHFILPLRAKYLGNDNLKYIVILGENLSEQLYNDLAKFPYVVYIQGSPLLPENLYRANILNAEIAVILSNSNIKSDFDETNDNQTLDAETIFIYKAIKKCNKNIQIMTDLVSANNIQYLLYNTESNINIKSLYEYSPLFASGEVYTPSIIDRITCQIYYNPSILTILEQILNGGATNKNKKVLKIENDLNLPSSNLYILQIPEAFIGETFEKLFSHLIESNYVIPLGLYRRSSDSDFYYVYTNPTKTTILRISDLVYVLGQTANILDLLEDKEEYIEENVNNENISEKSDNSSNSSNSLVKNKNSNLNLNLNKRQSLFKKRTSFILGKALSNEEQNEKIKKQTTINKTQVNDGNVLNPVNMNKRMSVTSEIFKNANLNNTNNNLNLYKKLTNNQLNDKISSKYFEIDKIRDSFIELKNELNELTKEYSNFKENITEVVKNEIDNELNIFLMNK